MIPRNGAGRLARGLTVAALTFAVPVLAEDAAIDAAGDATDVDADTAEAVDTSGSEQFAQPAPPRMRISVGPEFVDGGNPRYPVRSTIGSHGVSVAFSTTPPRPANATTGGGSLPAQWPLSAARVSSGFGMRNHPLESGQLFHSGVDLAAPLGTPIVATGDGTVGSAGWSGGYGLMVAIAHGEGVQTRYAHMSRLAVAPGQQVRRGEVIGYVGSTGRSTGPHLHYEIRVGGIAVNPLAR